MKSLTLAIALSAFAIPSAAFAQAAPKAVTRGAFESNLNSRFGAMDTNHDGNLSSAELIAEQQKEMQQAKTALNQQVTARFKQLDTNKDGSLNLQEFLAAAPQLRTAESPAQLLQKLDSNKDGKVSADEFKAPQLANFNKADANKDGTLTPEEQAKARSR